MRNRKQEIILGVVVFVAAIIVIIGSMWLSERYAGAAGGYRLRVMFDSVSGLQVGNPVTFRGVWVGKVLGITLEKGQPVVTVGFAEFDALPVDSNIMIKTDGLLGGQIIEIEVGTASRTFPDNALVEGESMSGIEQVIEKGGDLVSQINQAVEQVSSEQNLAHLNHTIARFDSTANQLNRLLAENHQAVNQIVDKMGTTVADAHGILQENRADLRETVTNLHTASKRLAAMSESMVQSSEEMKSTFENLNEITGQIRAGKGTLGKFVQDDGVYIHLERALTRVDSLVDDIKRDPTRYFNFTLF